MKIILSRRYYVTSSECSLLLLLPPPSLSSSLSIRFCLLIDSRPGLAVYSVSPAVRLRRCRVSRSIQRGRKLAMVKYSVLHRQTRCFAIQGAIKSRVRNGGTIAARACDFPLIAIIP